MDVDVDVFADANELEDSDYFRIKRGDRPDSTHPSKASEATMNIEQCVSGRWLRSVIVVDRLTWPLLSYLHQRPHYLLNFLKGFERQVIKRLTESATTFIRWSRETWSLLSSQGI